MKYFIPTLCLFILLQHEIFAKDFKVQLSGRIMYLDAVTLTIRPLVGVRVEAWDSDIDGQIHFPSIDDYMGASVTDANGNYSFEAIGSDGGDYSWSKPDVYIKVVLINRDNKLRLTDEFDNTQYYVSDMHNHDNVEGLLGLGTFTVTGGELVQADRGNRLQVWIGAEKAYNDYTSNIGPIPSGYYDVEYFWGWDTGTPWTNVNTTHWPNTYPTGESWLPYRTSFHEFAHTVRHSLDGNERHLLDDNTKYTYLRYHDGCPVTNEGFAFNEGWAEYWSGESGKNDPASRSFENECDVTFLLRELEKSLPNRRKDMIEVLKKNPGGIHSFPEFCRAASTLFPGSCTTVGTASGPLVIPASPRERNSAYKEFQQFIERQKAYSSEVSRRITEAKRNSDVGLTCSKGDCEALFSKVIMPHLLAADKDLNDYIIKSLNVRLRDSTFIAKKIKENSYEKWRANNISNYRKVVAEILLRHLSAALQASKRIQPSKEIEILREELNSEVKKIRNTFEDRKIKLPTNYYPYYQQDLLIRSPSTPFDDDADGISDVLEKEILARFRPFYKFSNDGGDEPIRPQDVLSFIQHSELFDRHTETGTPIVSQSDLSGNPDKLLMAMSPSENSSNFIDNPKQTEYYLNIFNEHRNGDQDWSKIKSDAVGLYGHVSPLRAAASDPSLLTGFKVEYWQFYGYNDAGTGISGEHEGDWEAVQLVIEPDGKTIRAVMHNVHSASVVFQMNKGTAVDLGNNIREFRGTEPLRPYFGYIDLNVKGPAGIGWAQNNAVRFFGENGEFTHPVVYIENGGHASWPTEHWNWPFVNHHQGNSHSYLVATPPNLGEIGSPNPECPAAKYILQFNGHWGAYNDGPEGPPLKWSWGRAF